MWWIIGTITAVAIVGLLRWVYLCNFRASLRPGVRCQTEGLKNCVVLKTDKDLVFIRYFDKATHAMKVTTVSINEVYP